MSINIRLLMILMRLYFGLQAAVLILLTVACSVTRPIDVNTIEPAPVELSKSIERIGIFNQQLDFDDSANNSGLNAWISHSDHLLSEAGKKAALKSLFEELTKDSRFDTILIIDTDHNLIPDSQLSIDDIPWKYMENICRNNKIDAIFALAYFDTDTKVSLKKAKVGQKDLMRENVLINGKEITLETLIENGWRIYDPFNKQIIDEIVLNDHLVNTAKGEDPIDAFQAIEDRQDSIIAISAKNGSSFGLRLQPFQSTIQREYYTKGSQNFEEANDLVQSENWIEVKKLWEKETSHTDPKIGGRACHNLAVLNEMHGDLESAMAWAIKANSLYESKMTANYINALENRILQHEIVERQLMK